MFKVKDYVIYNLMGVHSIVDIRKEKDIGDSETEYYVLQPVYNNNLTIKIPVNNTPASMRKTITKSDVLSLIADMPKNESVWVDDDKQRKESFKAALKTGKCEEWIKLIKTLYLERQEKNDIGKKLMKADEEIMKTAEKNLYEEFATALRIAPEEVTSFIHDHIE